MIAFDENENYKAKKEKRKKKKEKRKKEEKRKEKEEKHKKKKEKRKQKKEKRNKNKMENQEMIIETQNNIDDGCTVVKAQKRSHKGANVPSKLESQYLDSYSDSSCKVLETSDNTIFCSSSNVNEIVPNNEDQENLDPSRMIKNEKYKRRKSHLFSSYQEFKRSNERYNMTEVFPEIHWNPVLSKYKSKNVHKMELSLDLSIKYPLTYKAIPYIEGNYFAISKLNAMPRQSYFKEPNEYEKRKILEFVPNFKSGRFTPKEKKALIENVNDFFLDLGFSPEECKEFFTELKSLPWSQNGGNRGNSSHNLAFCKLYFASHVAGPEILEYRFAWDIYCRILEICKQVEYPWSKKSDKDNINVPKLKDKLNDSLNSINNTMAGPFTIQDSCKLISLVLQQQHFDKKSLEVNDLCSNRCNINWEPICKNLLRDKCSVQRHWIGRIIPILRDGHGTLEVNTWKIKLLEVLMEYERLEFVQDIDWKTLQNDHFKNMNTLELRTFFKNNVEKRKKIGGDDISLKQVVESKYHQLMSKNSSSHSSESKRMAKKQDLIEQMLSCYERNKAQLMQN